MQQFQDDIMRARQLAHDVDERLSAHIKELEQKIQMLEKRVDALETNN